MIDANGCSWASINFCTISRNLLTKTGWAWAPVGNDQGFVRTQKLRNSLIVALCGRDGPGKGQALHFIGMSSWMTKLDNL